MGTSFTGVTYTPITNESLSVPSEAKSVNNVSKSPSRGIPETSSPSIDNQLGKWFTDHKMGNPSGSYPAKLKVTNSSSIANNESDDVITGRSSYGITSTKINVLSQYSPSDTIIRKLVSGAPSLGVPKELSPAVLIHVGKSLKIQVRIESSGSSAEA